MMNQKTLIGLAVVAVVAVGAALALNHSRQPVSNTGAQAGLLAPGLAEELDKIKTVELLTANNADCDAAAAHLNAWLVENQGSFRDALRQQGEELLVIYDWCHQRFTPTQISTLVTRWNSYMDTEIAMRISASATSRSRKPRVSRSISRAQPSRLISSLAYPAHTEATRLCGAVPRRRAGLPKAACCRTSRHRTGCKRTLPTSPRTASLR